MSEKLSRRDFIKSGSKTIAALAAVTGSLPLLGESLTASVSRKSKVVVARNPLAVNSRNVCNPKEVDGMFARSLFALTGKSSHAQAWAALGLTAGDVVAVKVNCNTWTIHLSPHLELVDALCKSLNSVIPLNQIIFYERNTRELESGGFKRNTTKHGVRYFGNDEGGGYDSRERLTHIITGTATKIINLASLKCVEGGFTASLFLKNHIGSLRDADMPKCHGDLDFLAEVNSRPSIKNKTMLNLCDGLRGTYRRGVPWYWAGIVMGADPVAAEYTAIQVMNQKRTKEGLSPFKTPEHLRLAEKKYHLGICNPSGINVLRLAGR